MGEADIKEIFMGEAKEIITNLEADIVTMEENQSEELINQIFRNIHTLKGSSGIVGLNTIYDFTHTMENLLDEIRSGTVNINAKITDVLLAGVDWVKGEIFGEEDSEADQATIKHALLSQFNEFMGKVYVTAQESKEVEEEKDLIEEGYYRIKITFREDIFEFGIDPLGIIEDLFAMGVPIINRISKANLPSFEKLNPEKCFLSWDIVLRSTGTIEDIENIFIFVSDSDIVIENVTDRYKDIIENSGSDKRLGEILVEQGVITDVELDELVTVQESEKTKLGDIAVDKGYASPTDIKKALSEQENLKKKMEISTVRVDTTKLDKLLNLLGEIVIGQSTISRMAELIEDERGLQLKNAIYGLDRTTREFQEQIMSIRMTPVGPTFEQFRRFVRDTSHSLGKNIKLEIEGKETELDKTVIEEIGDPLKHMIRNSIDHGIESSVDRIKAGKDEKGKILLKAYHQEGNVYIEITDDGSGVNPEKLRAKAIEMKLIKIDEEVSKEKLLSFLFMPGFSTAEKVGDLSGRGVGMDVVKTNIESLRGSVEIKSEMGVGTKVRIKLPLTLAIIDGMLVRIGDFIYIIPLLSVVESIRPMKEDVKTVEGKGEVIHYRGEYISLVRLYQSFKVRSDHVNPWEALVVIVEAGRSRVGLLIDDLIGQQQIVIKSFDNFVTNSRAISGASILGDGKVALIIDIFGLIEDLET